MMPHQNLINFLMKKNVYKTKHSGRKLGDHLLNVYELLIEAGSTKTVAVAGGLHSIYGTNAFQHTTVNDRNEIRDHFGESVERLVYLFSIIDRPKGIESGVPRHWETKMPVLISPEELYDLRLIEAANLIEQRLNILRFPNIRTAWKTLKADVNSSNQ